MATSGGSSRGALEGGEPGCTCAPSTAPHKCTLSHAHLLTLCIQQSWQLHLVHPLSCKALLLPCAQARPPAGFVAVQAGASPEAAAQDFWLKEQQPGMR